MHLYIHIPFCKQACFYCDFHFSTNQNLKNEMAFAIAKEIEIQKYYLKNNNLKSIYFGGGTPSLLKESEFEIIFKSIQQNFNLENDIEITLEANPDDINPNNLEVFKNFGINRLSIGLQSFHEPHLKMMNRAHSEIESENAVKIAKNSGFDNLSIDLIYGIPADNHQIWHQDLQKAVDLGVNHISSYCLTIEPNTVFGKLEKIKKFPEIDEEFAATQFEYMLDFLAKNEFEQYEISNFAKNKKYSKHNTSYWQAEEYLGVGPSAHSFNIESRQNNVSNNTKYIKSLAENKIPFEKEILSKKDKINEYLLTSLRTIWGTNLQTISYLDNNWLNKNQEIINSYFYQKHLILKDNYLFLTQSGKLFADKITADLFEV